MSRQFFVSKKERKYLRELAKKQLEYAHLPIMKERTKLWKEHNVLKGNKPVIVVETDTFLSDILPLSQCETPAAKEIESNILRWVVNHELVDDDKVVPAYYTIYWNIGFRLFDLDIKRHYAKDGQGRMLGYSQEHPIVDLQRDLCTLKPSTYFANKEYTLELKAFVEDILGDILPVEIKNQTLFWHMAPSARIVELMGLEYMMYAIVDHPEEMHELYQFIRDDILRYVKWQEKEGLLTLNNKNDYAGAGSYGFTDELPTESCLRTGNITAKDLWGNMNSQETVGISPRMFGEFVFPYYYDLAAEFGLTYYGCCEPVHDIWEDYISKLPGLRKVSISPWCDEEFMGNALKGSSVIYSRKPRPNYLGVGSSLDEESFRAHILRTLKAATGCHLEFIYRDVYTLNGNIGKPGKAVKIIRELIESSWQD